MESWPQSSARSLTTGQGPGKETKENSHTLACYLRHHPDLALAPRASPQSKFTEAEHA